MLFCLSHLHLENMLAGQAIEDAARLDAQSVSETSAVQAVVGSMKAHDSHPGVQRAGLAALCNIAVHGVAQADVVRQGGLELATHAMTQFSAVGDVQVLCASR